MATESYTAGHPSDFGLSTITGCHGSVGTGLQNSGLGAALTAGKRTLLEGRYGDSLTVYPARRLSKQVLSQNVGFALFKDSRIDKMAEFRK